MKLIKRSALSVILIIISNYSSFGQPSTFFDFEGEDFQFSVAGMVATEDSLYVITRGVGKETNGLLLGFNKEGNHKIIKTFDGTAYNPNSLIGNATILYGTTSSSKNLGGAIFKYTINTGQFEIIKDLSSNQVVDIEIVHITDSVLWGLSWGSYEDNGSIFTIGLDGSGFRKIYNNTNLTLGQNPQDFEIVGNHIYISCYNGGGIPYSDNFGGGRSGSIIRINTDGTGYTNIFQGQNLLGTKPRSLVRNGDEIYVFFTKRGSISGSSIYRFGIDGSSFENLANLESDGRSDLLLVGDAILGITINDLFEYNLRSNKLSSLFQFNELSTFDGVSGPVYFNNSLFLSTQQNGPNDGGIIAEYIYEIVTSIGSGDKNSINFYPNPAKNQLIIDFGSSVGDEAEIRIFDSKGTEQISQTFKPANTKEAVSLDRLEPGIYLLFIISENHSTSSKLIKR